MIAVIALLKARAGLSRNAFIDYYENHHVPLVLSYAPGPVYYARNYLPASDDRRHLADFDVVTHMRFVDQDAYSAWLSLFSAAGSGVAEDEAQFLDRSRTRSWIVEEHHR